MHAALDLQVISTFNATLIEAPLRRALSEAGIEARIGFVPRVGLMEYMLHPPADSEHIAGTVALVRVEDWLRDGFSAGKSGDAWAREELKAKVRDFVNELGVLVYRGAPVWFMACPSNGWLSQHHKIVPLCRTYTNLLAARVSNTSQAATLNWPQGLAGDDLGPDQTNNIPFTQDCFDKLGELVAHGVARTFATEFAKTETTAASPELAAYLAGLQVRVELSRAIEQDYTDVDRIIRTAASFSLSGEQPHILEAEVRSAIASQRCILLSVTDRLAAHGPSGILLYREADDALVVEWLSLSCTVLGRQVEYALLEALARMANHSGKSNLVFEYHSSARNQPIQVFLESISERESANRFVLPVKDADARIKAKAPNAGAWSLTRTA